LWFSCARRPGGKLRRQRGMKIRNLFAHTMNKFRGMTTPLNPLGFAPKSAYVSGMKAFLIRWFVTTLAVFLAAKIMPGIACDNLQSLLAASLLLGIVNALIRPLLLLLSLPLILLTMGFFILVVNALMLELVGKLIPGFVVGGFWPAFFGSIFIGIASWVLNGFFRGKDGRIHVITRTRVDRPLDNGRVIDI
jgi:putative membrane protein